MKVYLPAISGHVPSSMVCALSAFLDFCYLVRRSVLDETSLAAIDEALARFHHHRVIFQESGVRLKGFSLPRQHSMVHYRHLIQLFGAPNGLCSSITESKHIKAVKEPWRRSNHCDPMGQMLLTNQRLDKLAASRADFTRRGMLDGTCLGDILLPPTVDDLKERAAVQAQRHKQRDNPCKHPHNDEGSDDSEPEDDDTPEGTTVLGDVALAKRPGTDQFATFPLLI